MPAPRPTSWPTKFPPQGGHAEVGAIADYMNEPILEHHDRVNAQRVAEGKQPYSIYEWEVHYYPLFPRDGWLTRTDVPLSDRQVIGPIGLRGFGLHEFPGDPDSPIRRRQNEMQALANGAALPPPSTNPTSPPVVEPPAPPSTGGPLPPGTPPPYTPPAPSPVTPHILILHGRHKIEGYFEPPGSLPLKLIPVAVNEDCCLLWALSPNNFEIFLKVVKSDAGYAVGVTALTNVKYEVTVTDQPSGKQQTFTNDQGNLMGDFRWNGLPA